MHNTEKEYAKALFALAIEGGCEERYGEALLLAEGVLADNPQYLQFFSSPGIPMEERLSALSAAFADALPKEVLSFLKILCERGRIRSFSACNAEYQRLFQESRRVSYAAVKSAVPLREAEKAALLKKLEKMTGRTVVLTCTEDASLLGGLMIEIDGKRMNASIQGHLKNVKDVIGK